MDLYLNGKLDVLEPFERPSIHICQLPACRARGWNIWA
ncbi:hypothetical protein COLO4_21067 [Corchorus olitorius]|uniref:Uncharacterized protein n=1 Tax=Corchorus olitorius TaxID=93759 RepID=A0A1R3IVF9_9ROSI|nr:hypothetical protein COLO4_21067 [Corchorus olitorius]